ncbi:MAG: pyridoxamine 5'-phosphate oxidase family protein [Hyphomicrobiales bacterium]|nr:pyridoxamine 5'-phosphate oxidase family protein [Hyphomicrobiales bacterium]
MTAQSKDDLNERVALFLDGHHVMSLATVGPDGVHAANLFFACDGLGLIWVSDPSSRHSSHIALAPQVAATIAPDYCDFPEIKGIQLSGRARLIVDAAERERARDLMQVRYPFLRTAMEPGSPLRAAYERAQFYRLDPERIVLIDNSRGFGAKEMLALARG